MTNPSISVLSPTYNVAQFLEPMVRSVVAQTERDWELIVVDDGSTDGTPKVLDSLLRRYAAYRIAYFRQRHAGCAGALKRGIEVSSAPICTYLGSDDMLKVDSLERILGVFRTHPEVGYLWSRWEHTGKYACWTKALPQGKNLKQALLSGWWGASCQQAWRRSAYNQSVGLDPGIALAADLQLAALLSEVGCGTYYLREVTYIYRYHGGQSSHRLVREQSADARRVRQKLAAGGFDPRRRRR